MSKTKYRNFGGSGKPFSRRPPMPREECSFIGEKIKTKEQLDRYLSGESIQCLICGDYYTSVSSHVYNKHKIKVSDYKREFGIPQKIGIVTKSLKKVLSKNWSLVESMDKRKQEEGESVDSYLDKKLSEFILLVESCNKNKISIYRHSKRLSNDIHAHIRKYKDKELIEVVKENDKYKYKEIESEVVKCSNVNCRNKFKRFGSQIKKLNYCCRSCASSGRKSNRIEKLCKLCGKTMLLTKGNYDRISTCCGSRTNSSAKGSAINIKSEASNNE